MEAPMKTTRAVAAIVAVGVLGGCGISLSPTRDSWYAEHYFIMQKFEQDAYKSLGPNGRAEFQKLFWESRPDLVKKAFSDRLAYIGQNFKNENSSQPWNTDRARIFLLAGPPASIERAANDNWAMRTGQGTGAAGVSDRSGEDIQATTLEVWTYPFDRFFVVYRFGFQPPNKWRTVSMGSSGGSRNFGDFELQCKIEYWSPADPEAYKLKLEDLKAIK
jgi:GWxTD domain-containing protein